VRNARDTVMSLAAGLGDFVVATAGPHLESVIAGRGSGAGAYSEQNAARVLNIDVGGGTSNYAVFEGGRHDRHRLPECGRAFDPDRWQRARQHHPCSPPR
jgi:ethanolamine utilization protein EutA (predicted chaperonin)